MVNEYYVELLSRDANSKLRVVYAKGTWDDKNREFTIQKRTGLLYGKLTDQPEKVIIEGKGKRTIQEQGIQEFKSLIKKYLDKGYKDVKTLFKKYLKDLTKEELEAAFPMTKTDANGIPKPMLAKPYKEVATKAFDKDYMCSRKIDGVRCLMYRKDNEDGTFEIHTASRGGKTYDYSLVHLINDPVLIKIFEEYPKIILDGEIYKHGWSLQYISGLVRLEKIDARVSELEKLQYWIYDIADCESKFIDRYELLEDLRPTIEESNNLVYVEHVSVSGWLNIKKRHDEYVHEGFEGAVIRRLDAVYGYGKRTAAMIKIKEYQDAEFKIVGWEPGLRPIEDMVFVLEAPNGKRFKAKPMGDVSVKEEYIKNINNMIGKYGTVKFFYYSNDGTPLQPVFKYLRPEGE